MNKNTYNGYKNYETWNVALHINNNPDWYELAQMSADYPTLYNFLSYRGISETPDGVKLNSLKINKHEIDDLLMETF